MILELQTRLSLDKKEKRVNELNFLLTIIQRKVSALQVTSPNDRVSEHQPTNQGKMDWKRRRCK